MVWRSFAISSWQRIGLRLTDAKRDAVANSRPSGRADKYKHHMLVYDRGYHAHEHVTACCRAVRLHVVGLLEQGPVEFRSAMSYASYEVWPLSGIAALS